MFQSYWVNVKSGQLLRCSNPNDEPEGLFWERINSTTYERYQKIIEFALNHQRK